MRRRFVSMAAALLLALPWSSAAGVIPSRADAYYKYLVGVDAELHGDLAKAEAAFRAAASLDPEGLAPVKDLIEIALHENRMDEAQHWAEEALKREPGDLDLKILLARIAYNRGRYGEAEEILKELMAQVGDDEQVLFLLGTLYLKQHRTDKGVEVLERVARGHGRRALMARFFLGRIYADQGRLQEAERAYRELLKADPHLTSVYGYLGEIYARQGRFKEAEQAYETLLLNNPQDAEALRNLLELRLHDNTFTKHREEFRRFLDLLPQNPKEGLPLAVTLGKRGYYPEALKVLDSLAHAFSDPWPVTYYRGLVEEEMGHKERALELFRSIPKESRLYFPAQVRVGLLLADSQGTEQAVEVLAPLVHRKEAPKSLFMVLSSLYQDSGHPYRAYEVLKEGLKRFPDDEDILMRLAMVMEDLGMHKEGMEAARRVLEMDPDSVPALNFLGYVYADQGIRLKEAQRLIQKALKLRPHDGFIMDSLGWVQFRQGRVKEAIRTIQRALEKAPGDPIITEHLGDCLAADGQLYRAIKVYRRAVELLKGKNGRAKARILKKIAEIQAELAR